MWGEGPDGPLDELLRRFERAHDELGATDDERHFCGLYLRSTLAMRQELHDGGFRDGEWVARLTAAFAARYLDALAAWRAGGPVPGPWRLALAERPGTPPLVHQLVGLNAHLNFDLPQVLLDVLSPADLADAARLALRHRDFHHVDEVMLRRIPEETRRLRALGDPVVGGPLGHLLYPLNLLASRRWVAGARRLVWCNAGEL
ncbi:DUF5995 family protein, partial [Kineococcus glutinatus]|uniref:DUF5995 family protein n=1 Tax=Kineococcus glutinatus TaxID=1070872 RepID=UPI0031EFDFA1